MQKTKKKKKSDDQPDKKKLTNESERRALAFMFNEYAAKAGIEERLRFTSPKQYVRLAVAALRSKQGISLFKRMDKANKPKHLGVRWIAAQVEQEWSV